MIFQKAFSLLIVAFSFLSTFQVYSKSNSIEQKKDSLGAIIINIDETKKYQTIDHFGASDAWSTQFVGHWPLAKREAMADLLFSTELDEYQNPKGIGLSIWRFNVGAGSAEQGRESGIKDEWRRAESFLETDGTYNWNRQKGQVWFAKAAKERKVAKLLMFPNSPPVNITKNKRAFATKKQPNLDENQFIAYADYLTTVVQGLNNIGLTVDYISPVNEPQWDWSDGGQEGTPFNNSDIAGITKALNKSLVDKGLKTKIDIAEAAKIDYLYQKDDKPFRSTQINTFFNSNSPNYIGDLSNVSKTISGHSYFTTSPNKVAIEKRKRIFNAINKISGLKYWMSEYCILGGNDGEIDGNKRDLGMTSALYMAKVIHQDLVYAQASSWQWWLAISPYNYKDGLIYIDKNKQDGNFYESKMLWTLGNYSRFVRPNDVRIETKSEDSKLLISSYQNKKEKTITTVIVNNNNDKKTVKLNFKGDDYKVISSYITNSKMNLKYQEIKKESIVIPEKSVVTIVSKK
ncbi:glycoside hydrolase [Wenyingzhuangia marina]|uniref:O-Glycosyl hydrolase n=1 Tax=Wenyingzhuangia marina TaxID=1195760 RepID=A0A1M5S721_9FLAO|nr:glycoside hydrolase [Wenyingzhuangia marina]GGF78947.1 xylanase [Wenyingzhuangia marina]SHH33723.1 O-Glycosyl hydrolase [Wenyingzhuangia marina]